MLPLVIWWSEFRRLFFFHDWTLLQGAASQPLSAWLFQPFLGEGILPLYKLSWIAAVAATRGSYATVIVLLWLTHAATAVLFGDLLRRIGYSSMAIAAAVITFGLPWTNLETLGWAMQWSAVLSILFLLMAWHLLLATQWGQRYEVWFVLSVMASTFVSTRGILSGMVLAVFVILQRGKYIARLCLLSLLPAAASFAATYAGGQHGGANITRALNYAAHDFLLNPFYLLVSYPGRTIGPLALLLFGALKIAVIVFALRIASAPARTLMLTFLAFDLCSAVGLGYARAYTGLATSVSSRYQYASLLCLAPALGLLLGQCKKQIAVVVLAAWIGLIAFPWATHLGRWSSERGTAVRAAIGNGPPDGHFDPSPLTVAEARKLIERYRLH